MYGSVIIENEIIVIQTYDKDTTRVCYRGDEKGFNKWKVKTISDYEYIMEGQMCSGQYAGYSKSLTSIKNLRYERT